MRFISDNSYCGALIGMAAMLFVTGAGAEGQTEPPGQPQNPQVEMQQIQQKLLTIQKQALDSNPELQKQRDNLESMATDAMEDAGHDPDALIGTIESAQETLQDESQPEEKRMEAVQEAQQAQRELQEAQQTAMQDEKVAEAHREFQSDLMTAMREEDPKVDDLIQRYQQIQQEMQRSMQQQQGNAPAGP